MNKYNLEFLSAGELTDTYLQARRCMSTGKYARLLTYDNVEKLCFACLAEMELRKRHPVADASMDDISAYQPEKE